MSLGGDVERLTTMFDKANCPYIVAKDYNWVAIPGTTFYFENTGRVMTHVEYKNTQNTLLFLAKE